MSDRKRHAPIASLLKCDFSKKCAVVDKISSDSASRGLSAIAERRPVRRHFYSAVCVQ